MLIQTKTIKQKRSYISAQQVVFNNRILRMVGTRVHCLCDVTPFLVVSHTV